MPLRPSRIHNKSFDDSLNKLKLWEIGIKNMDDLLKVTWKLGLFSGVLCVLLYIFQIRFMPSGLSLGDSLIFIFTALTMGLILIFGSSYAALSIHWFFYVLDSLYVKKWHWIFRRWLRGIFLNEKINRKNILPFPSKFPLWIQDSKPEIISLILFLLIILTCTYLYLIKINFNDLFLGIYASGTLFYFVLLGFDSLWKNKKILTGLLILMPIVSLIFSKGEILPVAMRLMGIRHENVSILTTSENIKRVNPLAKGYGLNLATCSLNGSENQLLQNVNILWTGIGNRTLVEVVSQTFDEKDTNKKFLYVQFDNTTIWPVYAKTENNPPNRVNLYLTHCSK